MHVRLIRMGLGRKVGGWVIDGGVRERWYWYFRNWELDRSRNRQAAWRKSRATDTRSKGEQNTEGEITLHLHLSLRASGSADVI